jgi:hypothetical protein
MGSNIADELKAPIYLVGSPFTLVWKDHIKEGRKGDLSFSVLAQIGKNKLEADQENQLYLNNIEAWWIQKYQHEQHKVFNITKPKITLDYLKDRFNDMVTKQEYLAI